MLNWRNWVFFIKIILWRSTRSVVLFLLVTFYTLSIVWIFLSYSWDSAKSTSNQFVWFLVKVFWPPGSEVKPIEKPKPEELVNNIFSKLKDLAYWYIIILFVSYLWITLTEWIFTPSPFGSGTSSSIWNSLINSNLASPTTNIWSNAITKKVERTRGRRAHKKIQEKEQIKYTAEIDKTNDKYVIINWKKFIRSMVENKITIKKELV